MTNIIRSGWTGSVSSRSIVVLVGDGVSDAERKKLEVRLADDGVSRFTLIGPVAEFSAVRPQGDNPVDGDAPLKRHPSKSGG